MDVYHKVFPQDPILLMAPTGLAAKRMTDSTHMAADTIHHACGLIPSNNASGFSPAKDCTIRPGFIGIDEMSMVGTHLFGFAMDAIPNRENTRIVLLGDVDQLSPVARGDALRDLIQCGLVKTTVLDCNYRQGADSAITDAAIKIREDRAFGQNICDLRFGEQLLFTDCKRDDLRQEADAVIETVVRQYLDGVAQFGVKGTIVLTPTHFDRGTPAGYLCKDVLNNIIRDKINPDDATKTSCKIGNQVFRTGDRVIQRKNTDDAINGDLGTIVRILNNTDGDMEVEIDFDGKPAHAEPAVTTKCGRPMSSARASQTVGMMPAYYGEVAEDLLKLVQLRKGEFSAEMQQRLLFYIYVYSVLKISYKRDGDAPAAEAVRAADALMRHPMTPEMLEQRISGLRASARYDRTSVSRNRVISDLQITVAEQKQLKRLLGHEEDLRRKSKSGMLRSERDAALDTAIVEMLAQGKLHREIGEKLGMARESVTRRIRRNNLLREVQEARNALAKEQARAKRAEKTKDKDDDDKNGGAGAGGTQAASKPQKKSSRKPMSESRRLAVLAVQRVRRAKERLARKCSICIRNLAKRYYRLNAARVEWIGSASAAESPCNTPFPQLC